MVENLIKNNQIKMNAEKSKTEKDIEEFYEKYVAFLYTKEEVEAIKNEVRELIKINQQL